MEAPEAPNPAASPMGEWLASVGLAHLEAVLRAHDIAEDVITSLTEQDMVQMGLSMGDRKRLLRAMDRLTGLRNPSTDTRRAAMAHTELRQLTIMFCDLVDATPLSARLSPEAWREVVLAYQRTAVAVITRHGGSVAQYLGDGLLVYFGYPQAHEDAAVRAVQAGLELVQAMSPLDVALAGQEAVHLQARVGLHTGMVVIGDIGAGLRREQLALGEAPNIAARLQEMALPDTVLITEATRRLAAGSFLYEDQGLHVLKGVQEPRRVWRVQGASGVFSRFDARSGGALSPMVGRAQEMALLLDRWQAAVQGQGQVVLISGEAGMGKSRLLKELRERLGEAGERALLCQCVEHRSGAFHALAEAVSRALCLRTGMSDEEKRQRVDALLREGHGLSERHAALMSAMLGLAPGEGLQLPVGTAHQREHEIIDMMADLLGARAARTPLLLLFEDVHWADPASRAGLERIVPRIKGLPLLLLITHRPEFTPAFKQQAHVTALKMPGLRRSDVAALVSGLMGGQPLPATMAQQIQHRTDGVPLFVEELARAWLEQPAARQLDLSAFLPATLRDSLMARLERYPGAKEVAQIGAAIGREFSHGLLRAVWDEEEDGEPASLARGIEALLAAGLVLRYDALPDGQAHPRADAGERAMYVFKHALVQDAAYDALPSSRKEALHARLLDTLRQGLPDGMHRQPALLARHAMSAGRFELALPLWRQAGEQALARLALHEAAAHLEAALQACAHVPASPERDQAELQLHALLGRVHALGKGWAASEVETAWRKASRLVGAARNGEEAIQPLWALCLHHLMRGAITQAQTIGQRMRVLAGQAGSRQAALVAEVMHTQLHGLGGQYAQALEACGQVMQGYSEEQDSVLTAMSLVHPVVVAKTQCLHARWITGRIDDVAADQAEIERRAQALDHPGSMAWALIHGALIHMHAGQPEPLLDCLNRGMAIARTHGFTHLSAMAGFAMGWCQARIDDPEEGVATMEKGLAAYKATGAALMLPCFLALLAEAQGRAGRHAQALQTLTHAWQRTEQGGERWHEAVLHRIRGELLASAPQPDAAQARRCFGQAIAVAAQQGAHRWQAQAEEALARLSPLPQAGTERSSDSAS